MNLSESIESFLGFDCFESSTSDLSPETSVVQGESEMDENEELLPKELLEKWWLHDEVEDVKDYYFSDITLDEKLKYEDFVLSNYI